VVIDDGSYDATAGVAAAAGATVHRSRDLMPEYGLTAGKGDVLWRSLAATSGDIVAFVDADIENPDPRFVAGLLGPLLAHPTVQLVKGFYDRPLRLHDALVPGGGGRVTELMARPMLNLLWPELAGVVQPLAGEYAARRAHLESVPFFTGYGVELGLLVDTLAAHGADSVAQVDLGERVHRNQPVDALSRMAFAIAQVVLQRQGADPTTSRYVQFARDEHHRIVHSVTDVRVVERPPMRPRCQPSRPASRSPDERGTVPGQGIYLATGRTA
jgi:glucosyl-3-phosphoglycerate synthase